MYLDFSQMFQYVCKIPKIMNIVELNSFVKEKYLLKNDILILVFI